MAESDADFFCICPFALHQRSGIWTGPKEKTGGSTFVPAGQIWQPAAGCGARGAESSVLAGMGCAFSLPGCQSGARGRLLLLQGCSGRGGTEAPRDGLCAGRGCSGRGGAGEGPGPPLRRPALPCPARLRRQRQEFAPSRLRLQAPTQAGKRGSGLFIAYRFLGPFITWSSPGS